MSQTFSIGAFACCVLALSACSSDEFSQCETTRSCERGPGTGGDSGSAGPESAGGDSGEGDAGSAAGNGQGGDDGVAPPLAVTIETLPRGRFNTEYHAVLAATGGSDPYYVWALTSGSLPEGLELADDGTISGVPRDDGEFEIEVTVQTSAEETASATLTLTIFRQRWLAYLVADVAPGKHRLYVSDVSQPGFPETALSADVPADWSVNGFSWAPNGETLLYWMAEGTAGDAPINAWALDMRGETPRALPVDHDPPLYYTGIDWSPDSMQRSAVLLTGVGVATLFIENPGMAPFEIGPARVSQGAEVDWLTNDFLLYLNPSSELTYVRRNPAGFDEPRPLLKQGYIEEVNADSPALFLRDRTSTRCGGASSVLDIGKSASVDFDRPALSSPRVDRVAVEQIVGQQGTRLDVFPALDPAPLSLITSLNGASCLNARWSPNGELLGWVDESLSYHVTRFSLDEATSYAIEHEDFGQTANPPEFSADGRWMCFAADDALFVLDVAGAELGEPVRVSGPLASASDHLVTCHFATDSKGLFYVAAQDLPAQREAYFADLSSGVPRAGVKVSSTLASGESLLALPPIPHYYARAQSAIKGPSSPDASTAFYLTGGPANPTKLYIKDMLSPSAPVDAATTICTGACTIPRVEFQPYPAE